MDNGQWVVFQKRKNGEVNFTRGWEDYVRGFGDPEWEYWLGLERIHCLTAAVFRAELRVDLGDFEGNRKYVCTVQLLLCQHCPHQLQTGHWSLQWQCRGSAKWGL